MRRQRSLRGADVVSAPAVTIRKNRTNRSDGFSLIDLMVALGVIAVLFGISLPALMNARDQSRELVCLSNLRGVGLSIGHYADEHKGQYPFIGLGGTSLPTTRDGRGFIRYPDPWSLELGWTVMLFNSSPWEEHFASWLCPGAQRDPDKPWLPGDGRLPNGHGIPSFMSSYNYSHSFVASPEVWSGSATADPALLRPVRVSEVKHPANKVMFWDNEMAHLSNRSPARLDLRPMLFADGHAATMSLVAASAPVLNPFTGQARRLVDTRDGVDGRDY